MAKTIEEQVKEIKKSAECEITNLVKHLIPNSEYNIALNNAIVYMHVADTKDELARAYYKYIIAAINNNYSDGKIIAGIMQNDKQNKKFNVDIDSVIKSLINIRTPIEIIDNNTKQPTLDVVIDPTAGGVKISNKMLSKIKGKVNYANKVLNKLQNNESENIVNDIGSIRSTCDDAGKMILSINPTTCTEEEIAELNDATAEISKIQKAIDNFKPTSVKTNNEVQQTAAAHNTKEGFNISNFIKQEQPKVSVTNLNTSQNMSTAFPHQICGLTDDQIVEDVSKHFKVLEQLPAYALYDLAHNKLLANKMKELGSKQRPNNPFLTQVNINEYIDIPELLAQYSLCFTIPCNDKDKIIVVLFNPNAVLNGNGVFNYPLHIFKATKKSKK